jgi:putative peptidoglycan lipid II flippase
METTTPGGRGSGSGAPATTEAAPSRQPSARRLARFAAILAGAYVISRILGLVRDQLMAARFSPGPQLDAYRLAFQLPDMLFAILAGGALGSAFIPVFNQLRKAEKDEDAWRMASGVMATMGVGMAVLLTVAWIFAPVYVREVIGRRVTDEYTLNLTTMLLRIVLVQPLLLALAQVAGAILNAFEMFSVSAWGPIVYNVCIIGGLLLLQPSMGIYGVAVGVVVGAVGFLGITLPSVLRMGLRLPRSFPLADPNVRKTFVLMGPRLIAKMAAHVNIAVSLSLAAGLPAGSASAFGFAWALFLLPVSLFGSSVGHASFSALSREGGDTDKSAFVYILQRSMRGILFFIFPAGIGLMMLAAPIVKLVYQRGEFNLADTRLTAEPLVFFAMGMWAFALIELLPRAFYALQDTRTPVMISVWTIGIDIGLSYLLVNRIGLAGLAIAWAVAVTVQTTVLTWALQRKVGAFLDRPTQAFAAKAVAATLAMALAIWLARPLYADYASTPFYELLPRMLATIGGGILVYIGASFALRQDEVTGFLRMALRRGK